MSVLAIALRGLRLTAAPSDLSAAELLGFCIRHVELSCTPTGVREGDPHGSASAFWDLNAGDI
jgi:hypothetical protein